jgi:hypothetical protein
MTLCLSSVEKTPMFFRLLRGFGAHFKVWVTPLCITYQYWCIVKFQALGPPNCHNAPHNSVSRGRSSQYCDLSFLTLRTPVDECFELAPRRPCHLSCPSGRAETFQYTSSYGSTKPRLRTIFYPLLRYGKLYRDGDLF